MRHDERTLPSPTVGRGAGGEGRPPSPAHRARGLGGEGCGTGAGGEGGRPVYFARIAFATLTASAVGSPLGEVAVTRINTAPRWT